MASKIIEGSLIKVNRSGEDFWCTVNRLLTDGNYLVTVENQLIFTDDHGLNYGDQFIVISCEVQRT